MNYDVRASWVPSVSDDVVSQELTWSLNGEVLTVVNLVPDVVERLFSQDNSQVVLQEGDIVEVTVVAWDTYSPSEPVSQSVTIPIEPPEPVTDLLLEVVEVV